MTVQREMPRYQCYKKVWALKIKSVAVHASGDPYVDNTEFEDGYAPIYVSAEWFRKHKPEVGGYYVVYEDGYKSFSPAISFENGYSPLPS